MADIFDKKKRSQIMSRISGKNTKPEMIIRKSLFAKGFRYRKNDKRLPGKPDIVLPKYNTVIFIHGCFWHGHTCKAGKLPETNIDFWKDKIGSNIVRDKKNMAELKKLKWKVIVIWQCELKNNSSINKSLQKLEKKIRNE